MLDHRVPGYIMTSVPPNMPPCVTAINQTPQDSCLDAKSHGTVSMRVHEPTESDRETSHGTVSMGCHNPAESDRKTSHGMVSVGCHKPTESDRETSHGMISMGYHKPR